MGFFDFVEKNNGEGLFHDFGGETFGVCGAVGDEAGDIGTGNVLIHVEADDAVCAIKINMGEGFGEFGFVNAGGAEEKESADGATGVFDAGGSTTESASNGRNSDGLVDHAFVDELFEMEEFVALGGGVGDFDFDAVRFFDGGLDGFGGD